MSFVDGDDEDDRKQDEWRRVCFLICPECKYLEFPGCNAHQVLYSRVRWDEDQADVAAAISCESCDGGTDTAAPFNKHCRACKRVLAVPNAWITSKRAVSFLTMAIAGYDMKDSKVAKTALVFCPDCKVVQFPGHEDVLLGFSEGRLWDEKKKEAKSPSTAQPSFTHFAHECKGSLKVVPVDISKEEATYLRDHLSATAPIARPKKGKTSFTVDSDEGVGTQIAKIFFDEKFCDVTLVVGEAKETFSCHKLILASRSPYFEAMFYSKWLESSSSEVELPDVDPTIFNLILKTIYQDDVELDSDVVLPALFAAKKFGVEALKKACVAFMQDGVDRENVLALYENTPDLLDEERFALRFIEDNAQEILLTDQFLELSALSVERIVASNFLAIREVDLWCQVVIWAQAEIKRREFAAREAKEGKTEERKEAKAIEIVIPARGAIPSAPPMGSSSSSSSSKKVKTVAFPRITVELKELKELLAPLLHYIRFPLFKLGELGSMVAPLGVVERGHMVLLYTYAAIPTKTPSLLGKGFPYSHTYREPRRPMGTPLLKSDRFEDNTGIVYWIGTQEGKTPSYNNPVDTEILVRMSTVAGASVRSLCDRNYTSSPVENSYGSDPTPWIEFDFKKYRVRPTHYFLAQEQDHYVRNWRIEGSDDGTSWTTIRNHEADATITTSSRFAFFDLPQPVDRQGGFYRRLRLYLHGPSHNGTINFDITEIEWYGYVVTE